MLSVFNGLKYSYSYEVETGHYLLHDNEYKSHIYLQDDDARVFWEQIGHIDSLQDPENKTGLLIVNTISIYFLRKTARGKWYFGTFFKRSLFFDLLFSPERA